MSLKKLTIGLVASCAITIPMVFGTSAAFADEAVAPAAASSETATAPDTAAEVAVEPVAKAAPAVEVAPAAPPAVKESAPEQKAAPVAPASAPVAPVEPVVEAPAAPAADTKPAEQVAQSSTAPVAETAPAPSTEPSPTTTEDHASEEPIPANKVIWSYTYNGPTNTASITASTKLDTKSVDLADPLAARAAYWKYILPASGNPSFPQKLIGFNDLVIDKLGTYTVGTGEVITCGQGDIYAQFQSKDGLGGLPLPGILNGPHDPYEPPFLHETLRGKGPNPTNVSTSSEGCNTPPAPPRADRHGGEEGQRQVRAR